MPNIACQFSIKCDCTDDPTGNFSSEDPDSDRTPSMVDLAIAPPLGTVYAAANCGTVCFSAVSQQAADDCAYADAQLCVFNDWHPPGDGGTPIFFSSYGNAAVTCTIRCADGTVCGVGECLTEPTFSWTVAANTVYGVNQAQADLQAASLACNRARANAICFITDTLPPACFDAAYRTLITARGGSPWYFPYLTAPFICTDPDHGLFEPIAYRWEIISGALPNGVALGNCTGYLTGLPSQSGTFTFTVLITDSIGSQQTKTFTLCVVKITTASPLPAATIGTPYTANLTQTPAEQETEIWSVEEGPLPDGLSLSSAGVLSGTPTVAGDFAFTLGVTVECPSLRGGVCQKAFTLTVATAPDPDFWWTYQNVGAMNDVVEGLPMFSLSLNSAAGIVGNGFAFVPNLNVLITLDTSGGSDIPYTAGQNLSMSSWFKFTAGLDANDQMFMQRYVGDFNTSASQVRFRKIAGVDRIFLTIDNGVDSDEVSAPFTIDGLWHHLVTTYDGVTGLSTLYVDKVQLLQTTVPVLFGDEVGGGVGFWQDGGAGGAAVGCVIDEFGMFFDHKLTAAEISFLYNSGNGRTFPY